MSDHMTNDEIDAQFRALAVAQYQSEDINIDADAVVSRGDDNVGAFVAAWVWVDAP